MERFYAFAGVEIAVEWADQWSLEDKRILVPFVVDQVTDPYRFRLAFCDAVDPPKGVLVKKLSAMCIYRDVNKQVRYIGQVQNSWSDAYARVESFGHESCVQLRDVSKHGRITEKMILNCIAAEHLAVQASGVVFHSSYIEYKGMAILFTAPSGTGKSTQADLWKKYRGAEIINGDRSVVRALAEGVFACGIPFAGSSAICKNRTLPLAAIVYLKQAPVTTIRKLQGAEAFRSVWEGCSVNSWDKQDMALASETVMRVLESVPVFELACTPDETAVLALEGALMG